LAPPCAPDNASAAGGGLTVSTGLGADEGDDCEQAEQQQSEPSQRLGERAEGRQDGLAGNDEGIIQRMPAKATQPTATLTHQGSITNIVAHPSFFLRRAMHTPFDPV
jgi:hypothetical protein